MILQALNAHYERLKNDPQSDIPLFGFGNQKIHFTLVLDRRGRLLRVKDIREAAGNKPVAASLVVPVIGAKRSRNIEPNFMWDNTGYVLGVDAKGKAERTLRCFEAFRKLHHDLGDTIHDDGMAAVLHFLDSWNPGDAPAIERWDEMADSNLVFELEGEKRYIHEHAEVRDAWTRHCAAMGSDVSGMCLVSGKTGPIARLHPVIKGVQGAPSSGAGIVSFNLDAFLSYDKKQNFNAPVCEEIAFGYTTALNHLLNFRSRQKVQIGNAVTVFWAEKASPIEGLMRAMLDPGDDEIKRADVRTFLETLREDKPPSGIGDPDVNFFILGLSPNTSRLSVRFWHAGPVGEICENIGRHFRDLSIVGSDRNPEFPAMWQILKETAAQGKTDNIPPVLVGALMRSVLSGAAYPQSLLRAVIDRISADQTVSYLRAAVIKAVLNRKHRVNNVGEEIGMSLDEESTSTAYHLGRLLAVLEKARKEAVPGANGAAVRDRWYGSASVAPNIVFPRLLGSARHRPRKTQHRGRTDEMLKGIMQNIEKFPPHLNLDDRGRFAIGYYHQRQAFCARSENQKEKMQHE